MTEEKKMRYGCCLSYKEVEKLPVLAECGFDYAELGLAAMRDASDAEIENFRSAGEKYGVPCSAVNVMFPQIPLTGKDANHAEAEKYLSEVLEKTAPLGFSYAVFGSGGARRVPDRFPLQEAEKQLAGFLLNTVAPLAEKYRLTICIEELNRSESNIINSFAEAAALAEKIAHPNIKILADIYHIVKENEAMDILVQKGAALLAHTHFASPFTRTFPAPSDPPEALALCGEFLAALKKLDYSGGISIEASLSVGANFKESCLSAISIMKNC